MVSGWSAGGHLTSMALSHPHVRAGMAISGIYDLEPIRHSYLNDKLGLDEAMSRRNSPMMQAGGPIKPLSLVVGGAELPLLRKQTADFAGHRASYGLPVTYEEIPGADHFTIMNELISPTGRITTLIRQLFERTARLIVIAGSDAKQRIRTLEFRVPIYAILSLRSRNDGERLNPTPT